MTAERLFDTLGPVLTRWTMGGSAVGDAPSDWREAVTGEDAELRLLALAGQFLGIFVVPAAPADLRPLPDIPVLALPPLPEPLRPLSRRCLKATQSTGFNRELIHLIAARGYTMHPADWMPGRSDDDLPDVYAPLQDWVAGSSARTAGADTLSIETWSDYAPAARAIAFAALRRSDPQAARALLAEKAADESAEVRLRLIALLATNLSAADVPFLQSLAGDRAPKVQACAASLLARLGHGGAANSEAAELAAFFVLETKGLLRRTRVLTPISLKTPAQRTRRHELFGRIDYRSFASALGEEDVAVLWPFGSDGHADSAFLAMVANTAGDAVVGTACARLLGAATIDVHALLQLRGRLDKEACRHAAQQVVRADGAQFRMALMIAGAGNALDGLIESRCGAALLAMVAADQDFTSEVQAIGLLATPDAARAALASLTRAGLNAADPRLDLLRLNAALTATGAAV